MKARIPRVLTWSRAALGPVVILLAFAWPAPPAFAVCLTAAFLSDVFDGILARRFGVATAGLRRLDSAADSIFYLSALGAVWVLHRNVIVEHRVALAALAALELSRYAYDWWKFRRETSYHMWSSKLWGVALFCAFLSILALGRDGAIVTAAIGVGIVADIEGLLISFALRTWHHDVPSIFHALKVRAGEGAV